MKTRRRSIHAFLALTVALGAALLPLGIGMGPVKDAKRTTQRAEGFLPSRDGFRFKNAFKGSPLPPMLRNAESGPLRAVKTGLGNSLPKEFGLCGGMSLAAADFYLSKTNPNASKAAPEQGTPLYEYLYSRQTDSMGQLGAMAIKFWRWMSLPDRSQSGDSTAKLSATELPGLVTRLKARQLVPLGLVYTSQAEGGRIWENHQVLAYAVRELPEGVVEIQIYDPNFPKDDNCLVRVTPIAKGAKVTEVTAQRVTGKNVSKKVRGFFAMPYEPRIPPKDLAGPDQPPRKVPLASDKAKMRQEEASPAAR